MSVIYSCLENFLKILWHKFQSCEVILYNHRANINGSKM